MRTIASAQLARSSNVLVDVAVLGRAGGGDRLPAPDAACVASRDDEGSALVIDLRDQIDLDRHAERERDHTNRRARVDAAFLEDLRAMRAVGGERARSATPLAAARISAYIPARTSPIRLEHPLSTAGTALKPGTHAM